MAEKQEGFPPPVSPDLYTREYFMTDCDGYDLFARGEDRLPERMEEALALAGDLRGRWILDIGCGRGELTCEAARRGAARAVGIDYSPAALELSRERAGLLEPEERERVEFRLADAKGLDFPDSSFDVVFLVDVYEHLHPYEVERCLQEVKRVLRPWGRLIVHTGPNTWFYGVGYPLARTALRILARKELPESLRGQYDDIMHVNEQSSLSLWRGLRKGGFDATVLPRSFLPGFRPNLWKKLATSILFARPFGYVFCTSLMAVARPSLRGGELEVRTGRILGLLEPPRGWRVLLVGDREGGLYGSLSRLEGIQTVWVEPAGEAALPGEGEGSGHDQDEERTGPGESPSREKTWMDQGKEGGGATRVMADPYRLPFPDRSFDALVSQFALDRMEDPEGALREWARVVKPGGKVFLLLENGDFRGWHSRPVPRPTKTFTPEGIRITLDRCGLSPLRVETWLPHVPLPALYRGDLSPLLKLEKVPLISGRGRWLAALAEKS